MPHFKEKYPTMTDDIINVLVIIWYALILPVANTKSESPAFILIMSKLMINSRVKLMAYGGICWSHKPYMVSGINRNGIEI